MFAVEDNADGTLEQRFLEDQSGEVLTIFGLVTGLAVGDTIGLYPGCAHIPDICDEKFDNLANYGGFDKMPGKTPFGTSIF